MRDHDAHDAVDRPYLARHGVELAADRSREPLPSCEDARARGRRTQREEAERSFRAGDRWERVVDDIVGVRR
jgi:hypothetical protein